MKQIHKIRVEKSNGRNKMSTQPYAVEVLAVSNLCSDFSPKSNLQIKCHSTSSTMINDICILFSLQVHLGCYGRVLIETNICGIKMIDRCTELLVWLIITITRIFYVYVKENPQNLDFARFLPTAIPTYSLLLNIARWVEKSVWCVEKRLKWCRQSSMQKRYWWLDHNKTSTTVDVSIILCKSFKKWALL